MVKSKNKNLKNIFFSNIPFVMFLKTYKKANIFENLHFL